MKNLLLGDTTGLVVNSYQTRNGSDSNFLIPLENGKYKNRQGDELDIFGAGLYTFVVEGEDEVSDRAIFGEAYPEIEGTHLWSLEHHPDVNGYSYDVNRDDLKTMEGDSYPFNTFEVSIYDSVAVDALQNPVPGVIYDSVRDKVVYNENIKEVPVYDETGDDEVFLGKVKVINGFFSMTFDEFRNTFQANEMRILTSDIKTNEMSGGSRWFPGDYTAFGIYGDGYFVIYFNWDKIENTRITLMLAA
jgi:hypothetical protein